MNTISRREFLKITSLYSAAMLIDSSAQTTQIWNLKNEKKPNVLLFVFDAMTAKDLSVYGYGRPTTPNIEKFADHSLVYHSHHAGGNFTTPGTATILTGSYPSRHRAINLGSLIDTKNAADNIFSIVGSGYYRVGYAQNIWADLFLRQFGNDIDRHIPAVSWSEEIENSIVSSKLNNDPLLSHYALDIYLGSSRHSINPYPGSLTLGFLDVLSYSRKFHSHDPSPEYPYGMPFNSYFTYINSKVFDGIRSEIINGYSIDRPMFGYFHLYSPHSPYAPFSDFVHKLPPIDEPFKPRHRLSYDHIRQKELNEYRIQYDQYIANVDFEFGRLINSLRDKGILENTYIIVTSDHGEVFERGEAGHASALLYEPIVNVPLLISGPGNRSRQDVYVHTSNVDLLPTIAKLTGSKINTSFDGTILDGLQEGTDISRSVFMIEAKENSRFLPLTKVTVAMLKDNYKLIYFGDYPRYNDIYELYDLENDPEERRDIFPNGPSNKHTLKEELMDYLSDSNKQLIIKAGMNNE